MERLSGHILLVEDDRSSRKVLSYYLERLGLTYESAENGHVAVEKGRSSKFDAILMDIQMPELDGFEATQKLREAGFIGAIIALTALGDDEDLKNCLVAGCNATLQKPVDPNQLWERLSKYLPFAVSVKEPEPPAKQIEIPKDFRHDPGYLELVLDYAVSLPDRVANLGFTIKERHADDVSRYAHTLRGSSGMYGFTTVSHIVGLIESEIRGECDWTRIDRYQSDLEATLSPIENEAKRLKAV